MTKKDELTSQRTVQSTQLRLWLIVKICSLLGLFTLVAVTRIPEYLAAAKYVHLFGVILFCLVVLVGVITNIYIHTYLRQNSENLKGI